MALPRAKSDEPVAPDAHDSILAAEASRALEKIVAASGDVRIRVLEVGNEGPVIELPASAVRLLAGILAEMAKGHAVTLVPQHRDLTTQQAADLLNVSRPHLIKLLEAGEIPFYLVGTHRRVRLVDVLEYKHRIDAAREETLEQLARLSQELGLDDLDRE